MEKSKKPASSKINKTLTQNPNARTDVADRTIGANQVPLSTTDRTVDAKKQHVVESSAKSVAARKTVENKDGSDILADMLGTKKQPKHDIKNADERASALEKDLRGLSENFAWLMNSTEGSIYIADIQTHEITFINEAGLALLGKTLNEVKGHKCYEVIQGLDHVCPFCNNEQLIRENTCEFSFFNPNLKKDFSIRNKLLRIHGRDMRMEFSHDMTSVTYKLAKKDKERAALLRTIPGSIYRIDARDCKKILWYDSGLLKLLGYSDEQFCDELNHGNNFIHPNDELRFRQIMDSLMEHGGSKVFESRVVTRNGELRFLAFSMSYVDPTESWDGIPSFYVTGIDVTHERIEEERQKLALEDAYRSARVANAAKTNFLSAMSHDIRTPMNAITGLTLIAKKNLSSPQRVQDCLDKIDIAGRQLKDLINKILDMSKIESGKVDLVYEEISLSELLQNVMDVCKTSIVEKSHSLYVSANQVEHEHVMVDGGRLQQVLLNLLTNAIKYTHEHGKINLKIEELPIQEENRSQFQFTITDNGVGISKEFLPHLFEPFMREESERTAKVAGTGLGMSITENIVHMMNGSINVKSKVGEGTEFVVSLPLEICQNCAQKIPSLADKRVLIVDDDKIVCETTCALLKNDGIFAEYVTDGESAIKLAERAHAEKKDYYAIMLDWKMPTMSGLDTLRQIRRKVSLQLPVIIISAYDFSDIEEEFRLAGANAFITKPLFRSKLINALKLFSEEEQSAAARLGEESESDFVGKKILLAEDNVLNREIASELLKLSGFEVICAENGQEAIDRFSASEIGEYACVLMDIQMPVLDGYQAATHLRTLSRGDAKTVPIIALTANAFASDVSNARMAGMNDHIAKPIDVCVLMNVLHRYIK